MITSYAGTLAQLEDRCTLSSEHRRQVGYTIFHGHVAALAVAGHHNKRAGRKVVKVRVLKGHFFIKDDE